jgi:hypothetical protein
MLLAKPADAVTAPRQEKEGGNGTRISFGDHSFALEALFESGAFSDVKIVCQGTVFCAHRFMLSISPVLQKMLTTAMREGICRVIELSDQSPSCISAFLQYLYCGRVDVSPENILSLLQIGFRLDVQPLVDSCTELLQANMEEDGNCWAIFAVADMFPGLDHLRQKALKYGVTHLSQTFPFATFLQLSAALITDVLSSPDVVGSERTVFLAAMAWLEANEVSSSFSETLLLHCVRFQVMSRPELESLQSYLTPHGPVSGRVRDLLEDESAACRCTDAPIWLEDCTSGTQNSPFFASSSLLVTADPSALVHCLNNGVLQAWSLQTLSPILGLESASPIIRSMPSTRCKWHCAPSNGKLVVFDESIPAIYFLDPFSGNITNRTKLVPPAIREDGIISGGVSTITVCHDRLYVCRLKCVETWDLNTASYMGRISSTDASLYLTSLTIGSSCIYVGTMSGCVLVHDIDSLSFVKRLPVGVSGEQGISPSVCPRAAPDVYCLTSDLAGRIYCGLSDGLLNVWEESTRNLVASVALDVPATCLLPVRGALAVGCEDGRLILLDVENFQQSICCESNKDASICGSIRAMVCLDDKRIACLSELSLRVWSLQC